MAVGHDFERVDGHGHEPSLVGTPLYSTAFPAASLNGVNNRYNHMILEVQYNYSDICKSIYIYMHKICIHVHVLILYIYTCVCVRLQSYIYLPFKWLSIKGLTKKAWLASQDEDMETLNSSLSALMAVARRMPALSAFLGWLNLPNRSKGWSCFSEIVRLAKWGQHDELAIYCRSFFNWPRKLEREIEHHAFLSYRGDPMVYSINPVVNQFPFTELAKLPVLQNDIFGLVLRTARPWTCDLPGKTPPNFNAMLTCWVNKW